MTNVTDGALIGFMKERQVSLGDAAFARVFAGASQALKLVPPLDRRIVGANTVPEGWRYARHMHANEVRKWIDFTGEPTSTQWPIPKSYRGVGVIAVHNFDIKLAESHAQRPQHAVAVRFGGAVVVGALAPEATFATNPADAQSALVGLGIGQGDVAATGGIWDAENHTFHPVYSHHYGQYLRGDLQLDIPVV